MTTLAGPVVHEPDDIFIGDDLVHQVPVYDGERTRTAPYGELVSVAASTKKGIFRIYKPDGSTNVVRDTDVPGEGSKVDSDDDGDVDSYRFLVGADVTATWEAGLYAWECELRDSSTTPATVRKVAVGTFRVHEAPSVSGGIDL